MEYKKIYLTIAEFIIIYVIVRFYSRINYNRENDYVFPIFIGMFVFIFAYEIGLFSKMLKKFSNLGKLSYSIYFIHQFFLELTHYLKIRKPLSKMNVSLYLLLVVVTSFLFYYFVEKNIINLKYYIVKRIENKAS